MENERDEPEIVEFTEAPQAATDRVGSPVQKKSLGILPWIVGLLVVGAVAWMLYPEAELQPDPVESSSSKVAPALAALPPSPDIPMVEPAMAMEPVADEPAANPVPLPPLALEDSDVPVREALLEAGNSELVDAVLQNENLIQRGSALIDGLSRGLVLHSSLPLPRPAGKFATRSGQGGQVVDPATYRRYDSYARAVADLDTASLVATFHTFRPLLEETYSQLGYDAGSLDNALVRSLDLVIATPDINEELIVKPKGGVYVFADPDLEGLPAVQKLMLRMGPDNRMLVRRQAEALRSGLLGTPAR